MPMPLCAHMLIAISLNGAVLCCAHAGLAAGSLLLTASAEGEEKLGTVIGIDLGEDLVPDLPDGCQGQRRMANA